MPIPSAGIQRLGVCVIELKTYPVRNSLLQPSLQSVVVRPARIDLSNDLVEDRICCAAVESCATELARRCLVDVGRKIQVSSTSIDVTGVQQDAVSQIVLHTCDPLLYVNRRHASRIIGREAKIVDGRGESLQRWKDDHRARIRPRS